MAQNQIEFDVPANMRDGTVLRSDVYRPGGSGPWPVLLSRLPYGKIRWLRPGAASWS
nr:CocE/NonD family hydrolase [Streptomyces spinoverrucosus]